MAKPQRPQSPNVNFRWDNEEFAALLADSASEAGASSPHLHARELLRTALLSEDTESHDLRVLGQEIAQLRGQVERLGSLEEQVLRVREDLATSVYRLLVEGGVDDQDALRWVQETLLKAEG